MNDQITNYYIVGANQPVFMERDVQLHIKSGWQPLGAPFCVEIERCWYQAMVKYANKPKEEAP